MVELETDKQLILFDGVCNLCNSSIQYIIKHDKKNIFRFAPLQGETGNSIIQNHKVDVKNTDSILLFSSKHGLSTKSTAALKIAARLDFPNNLMAVFLIVPAFIRNWVYDYIAKNRYKWFGKKEECMIPTPESKAKFLG